MNSKIWKLLCCFNLTIATRIIGSLGIALSIIMINFLIYDRNTEKYESTNVMTIFFGFDWKSLNDPSFQYFAEVFFHLLVVKVVLNMLTNFVLIFGTILKNRFYAFPWIVWNICLIIAKFVSFVIHLNKDNEYRTSLYIASSSVYLILLIYWWSIVIAAVVSWKRTNDLNITLTNTAERDRDMSVFDSPRPYICNIHYSEV